MNDILKTTITFNTEQKIRFKEYVRKEFYLKDDILDEEISLYLKAIILKLTGEVDFITELQEIEDRIKNNKKVGDKFVLNELFTKEEWENKKFFKMVLGRMFYNKCQDKEFRKNIGIIEDGKNVRNVQQYKKIR